MKSPCVFFRLVSVVFLLFLGGSSALALWENDWYAKDPFVDYSPSGVPDFDQRLDEWGKVPGMEEPDDPDNNPDNPAWRWTWDGPVAWANSLWWMDSKFESYFNPHPMPPPEHVWDSFPLIMFGGAGPSLDGYDDHDRMNVPNVVQELATGFLFTDGMPWCSWNGTHVMDMVYGMQGYLEMRYLGQWTHDPYGPYFVVGMREYPGFHEIAREVERCQDVVLLLGLYEENPAAPGEYIRVGGHYATMAAVNDAEKQVRICDPFLDEANPSGDPGEHTDAGIVSHDAYIVADLYPMGCALIGYPWELAVDNFEGLNPTELPDVFVADPEMGHLTLVEYMIHLSPEWDGDAFEKGPYVDYSPLGMPDFDQRQSYEGFFWGKVPGIGSPEDPDNNPQNPEWQWTWCGPVALANSLWWMDSKMEEIILREQGLEPVPPPVVSDHFPIVEAYAEWDDHAAENVQPFVAELGGRMQVDGGNDKWCSWLGTTPQDLFNTADTYLREKGLNLDRPDDPDETYFEVGLTPEPTFEHVAAEVYWCQDVILLLGFYQYVGDGYVRIGGHYVTCAGADRRGGRVILSDPFLDSWFASVLPAGKEQPAQWVDPETHNDASEATHDAYHVSTLSDGEMWLTDYPWSLGERGEMAELFFLLLDNFANANPSDLPPLEIIAAGEYVTKVEYMLHISPHFWFWKGLPDAHHDYAQAGVPDFCQRQDKWGKNPEAGSPDDPLNVPEEWGWKWTWCGPVAVANSLWWLDSKFETAFAPPGGLVKPPTVSDHFPLVTAYPSVIPFIDDHDAENVVPFVHDLAKHMKTDGEQWCDWPGTRVEDMVEGIRDYIGERGLEPGNPNYDFGLEVGLTVDPDFMEHIVPELRRCQDVILLLGFYELVEGNGSSFYNRVGGHYVTVAGVSEREWKIGISDPWLDTVRGDNGPSGAGRFGIPHGAVPHPCKEHNDADFLSHDIYEVGLLSDGENFLKDYPWSDRGNPYLWDQMRANFEGANTARQYVQYPDIEPVHMLLTKIEFMVHVSPVEWHWYWKEPYHDYAQAGVPDFSQQQEMWGKNPYVEDPEDPLNTPEDYNWQWTWCGPVAVANSLWWMDSRFEEEFAPAGEVVKPPTVSDHFPLLETYLPDTDDHDPMNVAPFVQDLASYMVTDGETWCEWKGTRVEDMYAGVKKYIADRGLEPGNPNYDFGFEVGLTKDPDFVEHIAAELRRCQDVILLLGFYSLEDDVYVRRGGHFVTAAGVDEENRLIGICDPFLDTPGGDNGPSGPGRFGIPHDPVPHDPFQHNDADFVSHDAYEVGVLSDGENILENYPWSDTGDPVVRDELERNFWWTNEPIEEVRPPQDDQQRFFLTKIEYMLHISPVRWYWKEAYHDYSQEGVPDFSQKQGEWGKTGDPGWQWTWCGPAAAANSLWWMDSRFEEKFAPAGALIKPPTISDHFPLVEDCLPAARIDDHDAQNVQPFIEVLADYIKTDGDPYCQWEGTRVEDMVAGIRKYIADRGLQPGNPNYDVGFEVGLTKEPGFMEHIAAELRRCQDVILLLGFYSLEDDVYVRRGGHFVTAAGMNEEDWLVGICDPFFDTVAGDNGPSGPGRFGIPHDPVQHDPIQHNDADFLSHDVYQVGVLSDGENILEDYPWSDTGDPVVRDEVERNFWWTNEPIEKVEPPQDDQERFFLTKIEYMVHVSPVEKPPKPVEITVGLGASAGGLFEIVDAQNYVLTHHTWKHVPWVATANRQVETRPAPGDFDGDGKNEIVVGLGPGGQGRLALFDDRDTGYAFTGWLVIPWATYNAVNGETWPACGDVDGDGKDEIVVGLGRGGAGWFHVFDDAGTGYATMAWHLIPDYFPVTFTAYPWAVPSYNAANGETRPAVGDIDGDGKDEVVIGLGTYCVGPNPPAGGWLLLFDDATLGFPFMELRRVPLPHYSWTNGETWPATGDIDGDGREEIIVGLGTYPANGGLIAFFDDTVAGGFLGWRRLPWAGYNNRNGETHPMTLNIDGDASDELVVGLGTGGLGQMWIADDWSTGVAPLGLGWYSIPLGGYAWREGLSYPHGKAMTPLSGEPPASFPLRENSASIPDEARESIYGMISGSVSAGGAPVEGAWVTAYSETWEPTLTARTDPSGGYSLEGLAPGTYYVGAAAETNLAPEYYDDVPGIPSARGLAAPVVVYAAIETSGTDFDLPAGGSISGGVIVAIPLPPPGPMPLAAPSTPDEVLAFPLEGAIITAYVEGDSWEPVAQTETDGDGNYTLEGLAPGTYYLEASPAEPWYLAQYYDGVPAVDANRSLATGIVLGEGEDIVGKGFVLGEGSSISGTVTDEGTTDPIEGATVVLYRDDGGGGWTSLLTTFTDASGDYELAGLPVGTYYVEASCPAGWYAAEYYNNVPALLINRGLATALTLGKDESQTGKDFALVSDGAISGKVTDAASAAGIEGVVVTVYEDDWGAAAGQTTTDPDGAYLVRGLVAGDYRISADGGFVGYTSEYYDNQPMTEDGKAGSRSVTVIPATTQIDKDFNLEELTSISGTVTDDGDPANAVQGAVVTAYTGDWGWEPVASATSAADGTYEISIEPGDYYVAAEALGYAIEYYEEGNEPADAHEVSPSAPATGVDFTLTAVGTIHVVSNVESAWFTLINPDTNEIEDNTGSTRIWQQSGVKTGAWTVTWGDVPGYTAPAEEDKNLAAGEMIAFFGRYTLEAYRVNVVDTAGVAADQKIRIQWYSEVGTMYQVQTTNDLESGIWQDVGPLQAGTGAMLSHDELLGGDRMRFLRLQK